jgi:hypothetical protein
MESEFTSNFLSYFAVIFGLIAILAIVLFTVAEWKILTKAGEKGWKSLIPFYNIFISHHIAGMSHVWFIAEVIVWICEIVFEIIKLPHFVVFWFGIATGIFTLISELIHAIKMCNCFEKGTGFKIGMVLFPNLFTMIIAFGKAEYKKPEH